ncbi:MAG: transglycosylase SLT domain-containing protein [Candidatus Woesearchaeota archaeon]
MKWWKSLLGTGLLSISMIAHAPEAPETNAHKITLLTERIKNSFSKYDPYFQAEKEFWKTAFLTKSSKTLVYNRDDVRIFDTVNTPVTHTPEEEKKADESLLDSLHETYEVPEGTLGILYGRREKMREGVENAFFHLDALLDTLENHNLPTYLSGVILIESGFENDARSHAGAVGIAQFMEGTARDYGLIVNDSIDERLDEHKSFGAFARYMKDAFEMYDNEMLAVQAYNIGLYSNYFKGYLKGYLTAEETVKRMGFAPRHYSASILIANEMLKKPHSFFPEMSLPGELKKPESFPYKSLAQSKKNFIKSLAVPEKHYYEQ